MHSRLRQGPGEREMEKELKMRLHSMVWSYGTPDNIPNHVYQIR